jgi:hypothetical protein
MMSSISELFFLILTENLLFVEDFKSRDLTRLKI